MVRALYDLKALLHYWVPIKKCKKSFKSEMARTRVDGVHIVYNLSVNIFNCIKQILMNTKHFTLAVHAIKAYQHNAEKYNKIKQSHVTDHVAMHL